MSNGGNRASEIPLVFLVLVQYRAPDSQRFICISLAAVLLTSPLDRLSTPHVGYLAPIERETKAVLYLKPAHARDTDLG